MQNYAVSRDGAEAVICYHLRLGIGFPVKAQLASRACHRWTVQVMELTISTAQQPTGSYFRSKLQK